VEEDYVFVEEDYVFVEEDYVFEEKRESLVPDGHSSSLME
jgi:hypothetical protein